MRLVGCPHRAVLSLQETVSKAHLLQRRRFVMTKEELNAIMDDIAKNGGLAPRDVQLINDALHGYLIRCHGRYPYYDFFTIATGKKYGDAIEEKVISSFHGFRKPINDTSFDALTENDEKIEIKSLRACTKGQKQIFLKNDRISPSHFSTSSYQQTKPSCCDWFVFHILYGDGSRLFVIPSSMISKHPGENHTEAGKIPLSVQHRNHETEGQVNLGQVLKYACYFEIANYDLESRYDFSSFQDEIRNRLSKIDWKLPK